MSDRGEYYHSDHDVVLNDPAIAAIIRRLKSYPTPTKRGGYPLNHEQWRLGLQGHHDADYVARTLRRNRTDIADGGWPVTSTLDISAPGASRGYPGPLQLWHDALLMMEDRMLKGYFLGPFDAARDLPKWLLQGQRPLFHPMFGKYELKSDGTIKTRLLFNLSDDSNGHSFNDCIPQDEKTVAYITILDVCRLIVDCDMKWLWCLDALEAYYRVPIAARFIAKMGVKICGMLFFFTCLVMGQATACRLYTEFADAVCWIIANDKKELFKWRDRNAAPSSPEKDMILHYIDDFFGGHQQKRAARKQFNAVKEWWVKLGIPTQDRKCTPPTQLLKYLGFLFNARNRTLAVPNKKLAKYRAALKAIRWHYQPPQRGDAAPCSNSRKMKVSELQSAVGQIRSIACVYPYVVPALRDLEEITSKREGSERVRITKQIMDGLKIVQAALDDATQREMPMSWLLHPRRVGDLDLYTDASTSTGVGGFEDNIGGRFFGVNWAATVGWGDYQYLPDITYLELLGVVLATKLFAAQWSGKVVKMRCDNAAVCMMVRRKAACFRRRDLNGLLLKLCELATRYRFYFWIEHIAGVDNKLADALSRDNFAEITAQRASKALAPHPTPCVAAVNELTDTWRDNARYVMAARFAAKTGCRCDHSTATNRTQCNKLNKPLPRNDRFDAAKSGNRRQRRAPLQWTQH